MAKYNGYKNWNHWNVSLWINNDEGLYRLAKGKIKSIKRYGGTRDDAAEALRVLFSDLGMTHTPDGAPYSKSAIRSAMVGL